MAEKKKNSANSAAPQIVLPARASIAAKQTTAKAAIANA
jgi:hypothetical protein